MERVIINRKIGMMGHFMYNQPEGAVNGQAIKTYNIYDMLCVRYGKEKVMTLDTNYFRKHLIKNYVQVFRICKNADTVLILPTANGLKLLLPILKVLKKIYRFKILYPVIGGWLPQLLVDNQWLKKNMQCVDVIYSETDDMTKAVQAQGFVNAETMFNFSLRKATGELATVQYGELPYKLCTFSRVTKTKGIGEAISAVEYVNSKYGKEMCTLDIFGPIDASYEEEFNKLLVENKGVVAYKGVLNSDNIITTLSQYAFMLFPTYYPGEGMPGAVLEAFAAGVPVIASNWHNNAEVVKDGYTGIVYELDDIENLYIAVERLLQDDKLLMEMHNNCLVEKKLYEPETVMQPIYRMIECQ